MTRIYIKHIIRIWKKKTVFLKNAIVPFCSSVLGTALVIGVCFGTPGIKNTILNTTTVTTDTGLTITEGKVNNFNTSRLIIIFKI